MSKHSKEIKQEALKLYNETGNSLEVSRRLGVPDRTIRHWVDGENKKTEKRYDPSFLSIETSIKDGYVLVISDQHENPRLGNSIAALGALELAKHINFSAIYHLGDLLDFSSISRHEKLGWTDSYTLKEELDAGMEYLQLLHKYTKHADHIMLQGNHDARFNKFLANHAPQFKGVGGFNITDHLPKGWRYALSVLLNKNTMFLHGHHGGVHAAFNNTLKSGLNMVTGHTHILEVKPFTDYNGTRYGIQTGTLATIKGNPFFDYTLGTPLNWQAGFIVLRYINYKLQVPEVAAVNEDNHLIFRGEVII